MKDYISSVSELLTLPGEKDQQNLSLVVEGIYGILQIAWAIAMRRTTHLRVDLRRRRLEESTVTDNSSIVDEDELVTTALRSRTLEFLSTGVLAEPHFSQEVG